MPTRTICCKLLIIPSMAHALQETSERFAHACNYILKIPVEEIAKQLGRDGSTISSLISRFSFRYANCSKTENLIAKTVMKAQQIAELQA